MTIWALPPVSRIGSPPAGTTNRFSTQNNLALLSLQSGTLQSKQQAWREKHDTMMERKANARSASGVRKRPALCAWASDASYTQRRRPSCPAIGSSYGIVPGTGSADVNVIQKKHIELQKRRTSFSDWRRRKQVHPLQIGDETLKDKMTSEKARALRGGVEFVSNTRQRQLSQFEACMHLAKKHNYSLSEVKAHWDAFMVLDKDTNGFLSKAEFEVAVRNMCQIADDAGTPAHLLEQQWRNLMQQEKEEVGFEEFLIWSANHAFVEDVCCLDQDEKYLRKVARDHGWSLLDVERVKNMFDEYDADGSDSIDMDEFQVILRNIVGAKTDDISQKTLERYFAEVDRDGSGDVDFEEFAIWFFTCGLGI